MNRSTFFAIPDWLRRFLADPFRRFLLLGLTVLGIGLWLQEHRAPPAATSPELRIDFFFHPQCPHCRHQKVFIPYLEAKYPEFVWFHHDVSLPAENRLLGVMLAERGHPGTDLAVPLTFIGPHVIEGFEGEETTGARLEQAIRAVLRGDSTLLPDKTPSPPTTFSVPLLGRFDAADFSLPVLAIVLGLLDGFNPCAMWVLVYLISLVASLGDRRKIWLLVGSFVASSGILYFLFMTAWLNAFLFLGYLRTLTLLIGLGALGAGILSVRDSLRSGGRVTCTIGDGRSRQRTMDRIDRIVEADLGAFTVFSVIVLAFIVNSIEFACSAALPAIFTHTLSLRPLPPLAYFGYILLYDFFFMLDDLIIFSLAVLALDTGIGQRYAGHCRLVGGLVLIGLGTIMTFWPELLR